MFVVQSQQLKNGRPKYDLAPAEEFGELVFLLDDTHSPFRTAQTLERLHELLDDFGGNDYLLPIGHPLFIGMASAVAASVSPDVNYLLWSGRDNAYVAVKASHDFHENCI